MTAMQPRLGFIGLGSMGLAMASNLLQHTIEQGLPALRYWNRTLARGDALKERGGIPCNSIQELVQQCDLIFISVSDDDVLRSVVASILDSGPLDSDQAKVFIDTTTVHPSTTASVADQMHSRKAFYVAAPVFGATPVAQAGQLLIAVAGHADAIEKISPFLQGVLARGVIRVGSEPDKALLLKTTSNFVTAGLMYLLSEAHTLAAKTGLPSDVLESLIEQNLGAYAHGVSKRLTSGAYCPARGTAPSSGLELGIKDVGHGVTLARDADMKLNIGELYLEAAREAQEFGNENDRKLDSSSVFGTVRSNAGLDFETDAVKARDGL